MDETTEDDERELAELESALHDVVSRIRLNLYRLGRDPTEEIGLDL
jgi:hypothetical protein